MRTTISLAALTLALATFACEKGSTATPADAAAPTGDTATETPPAEEAPPAEEPAAEAEKTGGW